MSHRQIDGGVYDVVQNGVRKGHVWVPISVSGNMDRTEIWALYPDYASTASTPITVVATIELAPTYPNSASFAAALHTLLGQKQIDPAACQWVVSVCDYNTGIP